jgi:hypothetical protein
MTTQQDRHFASLISDAEVRLGTLSEVGQVLNVDNFDDFVCTDAK